MKKDLFHDLVESVREMKKIEKAAATDRSSSDLPGEAADLALSEDARDLKAVRQRAGEPDLEFEKVVAGLRHSGKL